MRIGITYDLKADVPAGADLPDDFQEEFDSPATVEALAAVLRGLGHEVVGLGDGRALLRRLLEEPPEFVFNVAGLCHSDARLTRLAWSRRPSTTPAGSTVQLQLARDPAWTADKLSMAELMTVAASATALIAGARAATAVDFTTPDRNVDLAIDLPDLKQRFR